MADQIRATPTEDRITHDLKLTDGTTSLGLILCNSQGAPIKGGNPLPLRQTGSTRTSLQIRQGDADYSDYQLPYTPFTQKDWSGGRGSEDFEKDKSRYSDGHRLDTRMGDIILGGLDTEVALNLTSTDIEPIVHDSTMKHALTTSKRFASKYIPAVSSSFTTIELEVAPGATCTVQVIKDSGGQPSSDSGDIVTSAGYSMPALVISTSPYAAALGCAPMGVNDLGRGVNVVNASDTVLVSIPLGGAFVFGTTYWIVVTTTVIGYNTLAGINVVKETTPGSWSTEYADHCIYFKITSVVQGMVKFFEYKSVLYAVVKQDSGVSSRLYANGYRFVAIDGSTPTVLNITGLGIEANELVGSTVKIIGGKCYDEDPNYRKIVSNTTTEAVLDAGFLNTPDNTTEIVIIGCDRWTEILSTGLTTGVTSIIVANEIVYFAQGESVNIRIMREYNSGGTWVREFMDEGTTKATFLLLLAASTGKLQIWKFNNPVTTAPTASYAAPKAWGTDPANRLDFTTKPEELAASTDWPIPIGDARSKITGVDAYDSPLVPVVFKEDEFGTIGLGIYSKKPISELKQVRSVNNGHASIQFGVYLFFTVLDGVERYYEDRLDDIGANRDEGMPDGRKGYVSCLVSYPGGLYHAVDGTADGYSSVLFWNQLGYCEVYRAPFGQRIRSLFIQVIPGSAVGRLWVGLSSTTVWLPITLNPLQQPEYRYTSTGSLVSGWFSGGFKEINKFWRSVQVYAENLDEDCTIELDYQTDIDRNTWIPLPDVFETSPMQEVLMSEDYSVYGKSWRYRITLTTTDPTKTPRVKAITIPAITRLPPNKAWNMTMLADDAMVDHQGQKTPISAETLMKQLEKWADSDETPLPLTMHSPVAFFDNKRVFIEPPVIQPVEVVNNGVKSLKAVVTLSVYEA